MTEIIIYIIAAIVGFFIFMNLYMIITSRLKRGKKLDRVQGDLGDQIKRGERLLLYFYSPSCAACKKMTSVVKNLKSEYEHINMINLATDFEVGREMGIMGTPATVVVEDARIQKFVLGARSEQYLRNLL